MISYIIWADWGYRQDKEEIEDVGMFGVFKAIETIDASRVKSIDAYVSMVARSHMIHYTRRMMHRDIPWEPTEISGKIDRGMEEDLDLRMDVIDEIQKLRGRERVVLMLRFFGGWQQKEIAELLDCTTPNVWYIEKRALSKLALTAA
jgi:RNA polymerase sigma factor (sigma-70 family)